MKKLSTLLMCLTALFSFQIQAQYFTIQGNVSNANGGNISITAEVNDFSGNPNYYSDYTDSTGYYSFSNSLLDSFLLGPNATLLVYMVDCNMDTILQTFNGPFIPALGGSITADFDYCPSVTNPCNITASFSTTQIDPNTQTFVPNYAYIINNSIGNGLTYAWDFGDGTTGTGINASHTYAGNGPYGLCLTVSDTAGCTDVYCDTLTITPSGVLTKMAPGFTLQIGEGSLGTSELEAEIDLAIFPNPTSDVLTISFEMELTETVFMSLTDISGRLINQLELDQSVNQIDVSDLNTGVYMLTIEYGNVMQVERIIIR